MGVDFVTGGQAGTQAAAHVEGKKDDLKSALGIIDGLEVPAEMYSCLEGRIEIAAWILEEICPDLEGCKCDLCIIERYPLQDGPVVERIPL